MLCVACGSATRGWHGLPRRLGLSALSYPTGLMPLGYFQSRGGSSYRGSRLARVHRGKPRCLAPGHTKVTYMVNPPRMDAARQYKGGAVALTKGARLYYAYHRDHARRYILCNLLARPLRTHLRFMECGKVATGWWRRGCDSRRCRHGRLLLATHGWTCATFGCYGPVTQGYSRFCREAHE